MQHPCAVGLSDGPLYAGIVVPTGFLSKLGTSFSRRHSGMSGTTAAPIADIDLAKALGRMPRSCTLAIVSHSHLHAQRGAHRGLIHVAFRLLARPIETDFRLCLAEVFMSISNPRRATRSSHDLGEVLVVTVNGAYWPVPDTLVEIDARANEKPAWFPRYLKLSVASPRTTHSVT